MTDLKNSHSENRGAKPRTGRSNMGSKPGERRGGRKKNTKNKKTIIREKLLNDLMISGKDPLTFFQNIYGNEDVPLMVRMTAAGEAMPYMHKKMPTAIEQSGPNGAPLQGKMILEMVFVDAPAKDPSTTTDPGETKSG